MTRESVRRAIRTFVVTTLTLFIPGLLGWLNALTEWARSEGEMPFPDGRGLMFLAVSAVVGGVVGLVQLLWNAIEDSIGKGFLRAVPPPNRRGQAGAVNTLAAGVALLLIGVVLAALTVGVLDTIGWLLAIIGVVLIVVSLVRRA